VLFFPPCKSRGGNHESGAHYKGNKARDCKVESCLASAERCEADEAGTATKKNVGGWAEENRGCSNGTVGKAESGQEKMRRSVYIKVFISIVSVGSCGICGIFRISKLQILLIESGFNSVPGHRIFKDLQDSQNTVSFQLIPKQWRGEIAPNESVQLVPARLNPDSPLFCPVAAVGNRIHNETYLELTEHGRPKTR